MRLEVPADEKMAMEDEAAGARGVIRYKEKQVKREVIESTAFT